MPPEEINNSVFFSVEYTPSYTLAKNKILNKSYIVGPTIEDGINSVDYSDHVGVGLGKITTEHSLKLLNAIPQQIRFVSLNAETNPETVPQIPEHIHIAVINGDVTNQELIYNLPHHIHVICMEYNCPPHIVAATPTYYDALHISSQMRPESVAAIPAEIKDLFMYNGQGTVGLWLALPPTVERVFLKAVLDSQAMHNVMQNLMQIFSRKSAWPDVIFDFNTVLRGSKFFTLPSAQEQATETTKPTL